MDAYELIRRHEANNPKSNFFGRTELRVFGERLSEMRVLKKTVMHAQYEGGEPRECYVLSTFQRNAPHGGCRAHHYFDVKNFEHIGTTNFWK